jgi:hypothetical protein
MGTIGGAGGRPYHGSVVWAGRRSVS